MLTDNEQFFTNSSWRRMPHDKSRRCKARWVFFVFLISGLLGILVFDPWHIRRLFLSRIELCSLASNILLGWGVSLPSRDGLMKVSSLLSDGWRLNIDSHILYIRSLELEIAVLVRRMKHGGGCREEPVLASHTRWGAAQGCGIELPSTRVWLLTLCITTFVNTVALLSLLATYQILYLSLASTMQTCIRAKEHL